MAVQQPQPSPPQPAESRSRGGSAAWFILGLALIVLASTGSAFMAYLLFNHSLPPAPKAQVTSTAPGERPAEASGPAPLGPTMDPGEIIVNLAPGPGLSVRYARLGVEVEGDRRETIAELERRLPQVRDTIIGILHTKRYEDVATDEGVSALRKQLTEALQRLVSKGRVVNVYFTDFVVQ